MPLTDGVKKSSPQAEPHEPLYTVKTVHDPKEILGPNRDFIQLNFCLVCTLNLPQEEDTFATVRNLQVTLTRLKNCVCEMNAH